MEIQFLFKVCKSITVGDIPSYIDKIQHDLCAILTDISEAHFESASQAVKAYSRSGRQTEIESAITHLRDAFNIAKRSIYKRKHRSFLFGLFPGNSLVYSWSERIIAILYLSIIARLISSIYLSLGETQNSNDWLEKCRALEPDLRKHLNTPKKYEFGITKDKSYRDYKFSEIHKMLSGASEKIFLDLYEIDKDYLAYEDAVGKYMSPSCAIHDTSEIHFSISEKGSQFLLDNIVGI